MISRLPAISTCGFLFLAIAPHNTSQFYLILRIVVFGYFVYCGFREYLIKPEQPKPWVALAFALLYNPFKIFALGRPAWLVVNLITVLVIIWLESTKSKKASE